MSNLIWIDTASGTWGAVDGDSGRLMIVDLQAVSDNDGEETDALSYVAALDSMSDSEVAEFADRYGAMLGEGLDDEDFENVVRMLAPEAAFGVTDGQWVVATGRYDCGEPGPDCVTHGGRCD